MNNKSKIPSWKFWDWKSIRNISVISSVIIGGAFALIFTSKWIGTKDHEEYTATNKALILDVQAIKYIDLTLTGNKMRLHGFEITYAYKIKGTKYQGKYFTKNKNLAATIKEKVGHEIQIKYKPENPKKSIIHLKKP